jgi:electron-transferring-flavoprotein dehydrogenase
MSERETLDAKVLIVGGGPAGLACALHLANLVERHNRAITAGQSSSGALLPEDIVLLEKGREIGAHLISGAVLDPRTLRELVPEFEQELVGKVPWIAPVERDSVCFLTANSRWRLPFVPPFLRNEGNYVVSLNRLARWLGEKIESAGVTVFAGCSAMEPLFDSGRLVGVRTDDKGLDRHGRPKSNFVSGYDVRARVTVVAEGTRGSLAGQLVERDHLDRGSNPQVYALGLKELWEVPQCNAGTVMHTAGWPLASRQYGGGWVYTLPDNRVSVGLIMGLDYEDPAFDPHKAFQQFKAHPLIRGILKDGKLLKYGAKTLPEGGWFSLPKLTSNGALLTGDSAGFVNSQRLKGIHLAMKSGMLAAETAFDALCSNDFSDTRLSSFADRVKSSWIHDELWKARNYHQAFEGGMLSGAAHVALQLITNGRGIRSRYVSSAGHTRLKKLGQSIPHPKDSAPKLDGQLAFDRPTDMYHAAIRHEEDQPCHLRITSTDLCNNRCSQEYGNPCQHFCPAGVYEMIEGKEGRRIHLNPSNCLHCKTCDIMDPYQAIRWVPPEGGCGPNYDGM